MAAIIDVTYFEGGDNNIAQLSQLAVQEKLGIYISKYEPVYLDNVLGYSLYKAFAAGLLEDPIDPKWIALRDGAEYTDRSGQLTKWTGFTDKSDSPIASYVYYQYVRSEGKYLTGTGAVVPNNENAQHVSPIELQAQAFNAMTYKNRELADFIMANPGDYGNFGPFCYWGFWSYGWDYTAFPWYYHRKTLRERKRLDFFMPVNPYNL